MSAKNKYDLPRSFPKIFAKKKKKKWKCLFGDYKGIGNFSVCPCESDS